MEEIVEAIFLFMLDLSCNHFCFSPPLQGLQQLADAMEPGNTDMSKTDMIMKNDVGALSRSDLSFPLPPIISYCFFLPLPDNDLFAGLLLRSVDLNGGVQLLKILSMKRR